MGSSLDFVVENATVLAVPETGSFDVKRGAKALIRNFAPPMAQAQQTRYGYPGECSICWRVCLPPSLMPWEIDPQPKWRAKP